MRQRTSGLGTAVLALAGIACAIDVEPENPLPEVDLTNAEPAVRDQIEDAIADVESAPADPGALARLAMLLQAYQRPATAAGYYERARATGGGSPRWAYLQGVAEAAAGDSASALASFRESAALDPSYTASRLRLAKLLAARGDAERARLEYEAILRQGPNAAAHLALGNAALAEGNVGAAIAHLKKACSLRPRLRGARYALARAYREAGETAKAETEFALFQQAPRGIRAFDDPWMEQVERLRVGSFEHHFRTARRHEDAGRMREARAEYERAAEIDPAAPRVYVNLMAVAGRLGDLDAVRIHYEKAVELDPEIEELHYNYGVLMLEQKRFERASLAFQAALEINPQSATAHNNLGYSLEQLGRGIEAETAYETAIRAQPDYALPYVHLARRRLDAGRYVAAIPYLKSAAQLDDKQAPYLTFLLARAYAAAGNVEEAESTALAARGLAQDRGSMEIVEAIERHFPTLQ